MASGRLTKLTVAVLSLCLLPGFFWSSEPKTILEAIDDAVTQHVRIVRDGNTLEIEMRDRNTYKSERQFIEMSAAALAALKFNVKHQKPAPDITVWHYVRVKDQYGNIKPVRSGSLKWSKGDLEKIQTDNFNDHDMLNLAKINDLLPYGQVARRLLCEKSYASLFRNFCLQ